MNNEFTSEELKDVIRSARICNPGFSEAKMQSLVEFQTRLSEAGYLEAVSGLASLEKEKAVSIDQTLVRTKQLLKEKEILEKNTAVQRSEFEKLQVRNQEMQRRLEELTQAIDQAQKGLKEVNATQLREELAASKEKEKLARELDVCRQKAKVTHEEVAIASQIKAEIGALGFSLELVLNLAREFGGQANACQELTEELKKQQTVRGYTATLEAKAQEQKKFVDQENRKWLIEEEKRQTEVKRLEGVRFNLENVLNKLKEDKAYEDDIRRFHRRYWNLSGLLDCLATWDQVIFLRCHNPVDTMAGYFNPAVKNAHIWTDKPAMMCPHCGLKILGYDEKPYQAINRLVGTPLRVVVGE
jgi:DNA repair exonuclease SbcCD ATPase subunit